MSQWFGGQGRKGGKATPEDSSEFSRGRAGRPIRPGNEPQVSRPGASRPQPTRPQPGRPQQNFPPPESSKDWNPNLGRGVGNDIYSDNSSPETRIPENRRTGNGVPETRVPDSQVNQNYQNYQQYQDYQDDQNEQNEQSVDYGSEEEGEAQEETAVQIGFKRRLVALILDFLAFYVVACAVMLIPFLNSYLSVNLVLCLLLLFRDILFQGRGIGKNLMGLQVIDAQTGGEPTLKQAALRNIVLFGPYLVIQVIGLVLHFIPIAMVNQVVITIVNVVGLLYVVAVFPMEIYRAYTRPDGRRLGDELAQTEVIDSIMDFTQPFPLSSRR
jgi:uncharacterized RDD family membrane protein YckC